jgi:hypothetical protein
MKDPLRRDAYNASQMGVSLYGRHASAENGSIRNAAAKSPLSTSDLNSASISAYGTFAEKSGDFSFTGGGSSRARRFGRTSWEELGLAAPSFGPGISTVAAATSISLSRGALSVMVDDAGNWTVRGRLPDDAWDRLAKALQEEMV